MKNNTILQLIILLVVLTPFISGKAINLNKPFENYSTIQDAINNADEGNIIFIEEGVYNEKIIINKSLSILGNQNSIDAKIREFWENESILKSEDPEGTIEIKSNNVLIDGIKIIESIKGVYVSEESSNITIKNTIILNSTSEGINLLMAKTGKIENNFISGASEFAITCGNDMGTFSKEDDLITQAIIKNNLIKNSRFGIGGYQKNSLIEGNIIKDYYEENSAGIIGQMTNCVIKNNTISGYSSGAGFVLSTYTNRTNSSKITFEKNIITENFIGILSNQSVFGKSITINNNKIFGNSIGVLNAEKNSFEVLNAKYNFWGECDGPGGEGNGSGDVISRYIDYKPFLGICIVGIGHGECPIEGEKIDFYANASTETCISEFIFSFKINGSWVNFSGSYDYLNRGEYFVEINKNNSKEGDFYWKIYTKDCYDNVYNISQGSFFIYPKTKLRVYPEEPDGENGWYITNPLFELINKNSTKIYYRWDSKESYIYSGIFGFENAPNSQNATGGIIDLNFWSEFQECNKNETSQKIFIKTDLTSSEIKELLPKNNSIANGLKPKISGHIDEIYQSNSGVDISKIVMKIDGEEVLPEIIQKNRGVLVEYFPEKELEEGFHNASIYSKDYSGRESYAFWEFKTKKVDEFELNVYSPESTIYGSNKIKFNISTNKPVEKIEFIDLSSKNPKWIKLCSNCTEYGKLINKTKVFSEGEHNLIIRGINSEGFSNEKSFLIFIDSKKPKIYTTSPKINSFTGGSDFYIKLTEENLEKIELIVNKSLIKEINLTKDCSFGKYTECYLNADLNELNGKETEYYFKVYDVFRSEESEHIKIKIDSIHPELKIILPKNNESYVKKVPFNILVNEKNFRSIKLAYEYKGELKETILCTKLTNNFCNTTKIFYPGNYSITIISEDKAGNLIGVPIKFEVR